jgi:murein DD-endopeptidase MepM/ murein hydrolase activator NlpD
MSQTPEYNFDDTHPVVTVRPPDEAPRSRVGGVLLLGGAMLFTVLAIGVFLLPSVTPAPVPPADVAAQLPTQTQATENTALPVASPISLESAQVVRPDGVPTINAERVASLLQTPVAQLQNDNVGNRLKYDPFTFVPERPRSEFVTYTAVSGDTIDAIAQRYNLKSESIAWCNDRSIIFVLRPGDVLNIPPVDGACHVVLATRNETIASVAEQYQVSPQDLINSPYANYYDLSVDSVLSGGLNLFIPGGQGELITWNPPSEIERDENGNVSSVSFAKGLAGSCGAVSPGGGAAWGNPLPNGTWVRGFSVGHTGIDISASVGTPIYAANSGPVLFSGFSNWGYGETVVLGHGIMSTLYGHMSARNVVCGGYVSVGQVVGLVGSTGNSTGPHLHFEIRSNDQPQNPSGTPGIGW